jgi:LPXTG-motif cell wall-anchored protein
MWLVGLRRGGLVLLRKMLVLFGASLVALLVALPAAAWADYPPSSGNLNVGSSKVAPGGSVTISGGGCASSADVALAVAGVSAGSTTADVNGDFSGSVTIPSSASGDVTVTATCVDPDGATRTLSATVTVSASGSSTAPLPRTGSSSTFPSVALAIVLLCVGAAFVVATRRRALARGRAGQ